MPRETQSRKPERQVVNPATRTPGVDVVASQVVATPKNGLQRVASALGFLQPSVERRAEFEAKERSVLEENQKVLDGQTYGIEVANEARKHYMEWKDSDDPESAIEAYHNEALNKIADPSMRKAAQGFILNSLNSLKQTHTTKQIEDFELQLQQGQRSVGYELAQQGVLHTTEGLNAYLEDSFQKFGDTKEAAAALMDVLESKAIEFGDPTLLDSERLLQIKSGDVPFEHIYKDRLVQARSKAEGLRLEKTIKENFEARLGVKEKAKTGGYSRRDLLKLRESNPDLFTQSEWEGLYFENLSAKVSGLENMQHLEMFRRGHGSMVPKKAGQAILNKMVEGAPDFRSALDIVAEQGMVYEPWATELNVFSTVRVEDFNGEVPEKFLRAYHRYSEMAVNQGVLNRHLTNKPARDMLEAFDYALKYRRATPEDAYVEASRLANDVGLNSQRTQVNYKLMDKAMKDVETYDYPGLGTEAINYNELYPIVRQGILHRQRLGAPDDVAVERTIEELVGEGGAFQMYDGVLSWTGGAPIPSNADEIKAAALEVFKTRHGLTELDEDIYTIRPIETEAGLWQVWNKETMMPTDFKFDYGHYVNAVQTNPAELSEERNRRASEYKPPFKVPQTPEELVENAKKGERQAVNIFDRLEGVQKWLDKNEEENPVRPIEETLDVLRKDWERFTKPNQ